MPWWVLAIIAIATLMAALWLRNRFRRGQYIHYDRMLSESLDIIGQTLQKQKVLIQKWNSVQDLSMDTLVQQEPPVTKGQFVEVALIEQKRHLRTVNEAQFRFVAHRPPKNFGPVQDAMLSLFSATLHELIVPLDDHEEQTAAYARTQRVIATYNEAYRTAIAAIE